jgi:hypothetical protein
VQTVGDAQRTVEDAHLPLPRPAFARASFASSAL